MIEILFFGRVADWLGKRRMAMALPEAGLSLLALRAQIFVEDNDAGIRMSLNQNIVTDNLPLSDGDEVAFFSVFSGG